MTSSIFPVFVNSCKCLTCFNILKENKDNEMLQYNDIEGFDSSEDEKYL